MSSTTLQITSNLYSNVILTAQKCAGTSHGYSVIALLMLDRENRGYRVEVTFDSSAELQNAAEQMYGVWGRCEANKVLFRSYRVNGTPMETYNGAAVVSNDNIPTSPDEYGNYKVIIDTYFDELENKMTYKFHRWNEAEPRVLILKV